MKRKSISIYSVLISLVFLFAIIYFAVAMTIEYKNGNYRAEQLFSMLCKNVENSADGFPSMNLIEENGNFAAVTLFRNRKCIFSYPNEDAQNMEGTQFIKVSKRTIKKGNNTLELAAAIYILRPLSIFRYGKISFVVILIATLFTIGLIIYYSIKDSNEPEEIDEETGTEENSHDENPRDINTRTYTSETEAEPDGVNNSEESENAAENKDDDNNRECFENRDEEIQMHNESEASLETEEPAESEAHPNAHNEKDDNNESEQMTSENPDREYDDGGQNADLNENALNDAEGETQNKGGIQERIEQDTTSEQSSQNETKAFEESNKANQDEKNITDALVAASETANNEAKAIFSVETGFCLQSQLQTRLDAELVRCGASELDLSLFIVKITGSEISKESAKKIGECLLGRIQFRDCIFEHGENSFAIIIPEIEIEQAEDFAEELFNDISKIIDDTDADCFIGISARTMRVISASRLINEAEEALEHAVKDGKSKIIGFHVDIEKYRQFIKDNAE